MFIRFISKIQDKDSKAYTGIFILAYQLLESGDLNKEENQALKDLINWFNKNLEIPDILEKKGTQRAISWFVGKSNINTKRIWELVNFLKSHSINFEMTKTNSPGEIIYSDSYQIVAFPYRKDRIKS